MRLSFSHISTYLTCPKRYWYRFVEKIPEPLGWRVSLGTSVHNALYRFAQETQGDRLWKRLEDGRSPKQQPSLFGESEPVVPPLERLLTLFDENWVHVGYTDSTAMYTAKQEAMDLLRQWYAKRSHELLSTVAVELPFKEQVGDIAVGGRFDRIDRREGELFVIDYKSGAVRSQEEVDTDMQLGLYALVLHDYLGLDTVRLGLYFLRDDLLLETVRDAEQSRATKDTLRTVGAGIAGEHFSATPSPDRCSYCSFRTLCPERA